MRLLKPSIRLFLRTLVIFKLTIIKVGLVNILGKLLNYLFKHQEALEALDKAIKINPTNSLAYNNKGNDHSKLAIALESLKIYDKAI